MAYIAGRWNITFTVSGLYKGLKQHGFSYKKPKGVPHKFAVEKRRLRWLSQCGTDHVAG
ncbi:helix-turn-helix domain-containing protein [Candidatus Fukatsuia symbiotica]|uniref:helix-turn-helix domain-containing protein n=1 Tax=Candidatus Fukatsuia symbiotica TaxID=1878942 RepID=UPI000E741B1E